MTQTPLVEGRHDGGFLVSESRGHRARDRATLSGGVFIQAGTVLGRKLGGTAAFTAKAGNTGNGAFTLDATSPVQGNAQPGTYAVRCTTAATNSGTFRVFDPKGDVLGDVVVGQTFSDHIKFAIADGATDFAVGDEFDVSVSALSKVFVPLSLTATDGSQVAAGISFANVDVTLADAPNTVVTRDCEVNASELFWPTGATTAQIATGLAQLAGLGIVPR